MELAHENKNNRAETKLPHFVIAGYKWHCAEPSKGLSSCHQFLWGSFESSNVGTYSAFYFDEEYSAGNSSLDEALISRCYKEKPDALVLVWGVIMPPCLNISLSALVIIREKLHIPIITIWWDTWSCWLSYLAEAVNHFADLAVVTDSIEHFNASPMREKYCNLFPNPDLRIFYDSGLPRDIQLSFNGSIKNFPDRQSGLTALQDNGVDVYKSGGILEEHLELHDYAAVFQRSKITLNFNKSGDRNTLKGRTIEATLCGALLLESANAETEKYFSPMRDYVSFTDEYDLISKAIYYLEHDAEREQIAKNGNRRATELCSENNFWRNLSNKLNKLKTFIKTEFYQTVSEKIDCSPYNTISMFCNAPVIEINSSDDFKTNFNNVEGTLIVTATRSMENLSGPALRVFSCHDHSFYNYFDILLDADNNRVNVHSVVDNISQPFLTGRLQEWLPGETAKIGILYSSCNMLLTVNGIPVDAREDISVSSNLKFISVGKDFTGGSPSAISDSNICYSPVRLPDSIFFASGYKSKFTDLKYSGNSMISITDVPNSKTPTSQLISIITICRNSEKTIRRCIESVLAQTYTHFEYIIQDGVSTDRTVEIIREFNDPRIKLVSEPDSGGSHAYYKALCRCTGDIITLCWSDEELLPHAVQWGVDNMAQHPEAAAVYGDVYSTDIRGMIDENSQPAPAWDLPKFLCWEMMTNYCASFMRRQVLRDSGFFEFTGKFIDAGKTKLEDANCIMYDYFALPALQHPILHVPGYVGKFSVHGDQLSSTPKVIFGMIPGLIRSIDNICDNPLVSEEIRSLKPRAYAGVHLAMINTLIMNAKSYDDAKTMLRTALSHEPDLVTLEKVCRESCDHLLHIGEFAHALEFLSILEHSGHSFPNFRYLQAVAYLESGMIGNAQESIRKELESVPDNPGVLGLDSKLRTHLAMQEALAKELSIAAPGPRKKLVSQLLYFTSLAENQTLKRLGQIMNAGISSQSFIDAATILEKAVNTKGFLSSVRENLPEACPLIEKTVAAYFYLAVEQRAGEMAGRLAEALAEYYGDTAKAAG